MVNVLLSLSNVISHETNFLNDYMHLGNFLLGNQIQLIAVYHETINQVIARIKQRYLALNICLNLSIRLDDFKVIFHLQLISSCRKVSILSKPTYHF